MKMAGIHHVAYRCNDTQETIDFYKKHLNMDLILAISEDRVPSTKAPDPYMHIFWMQAQGMFWRSLNCLTLHQWGATKTRQTGCNTSH